MMNICEKEVKAIQTPDSTKTKPNSVMGLK